MCKFPVTFLTLKAYAKDSLTHRNSISPPIFPSSQKNARRKAGISWAMASTRPQGIAYDKTT